MENFDEKKTIHALNDFCLKYDNQYNFVQDRRIIENAVRIGKKNNIIKGIVSVDITIPELDTISQIKDFKKQKILFAMLVISKATHNNSDRYFVARNNDRHVMNMAKAGISISKYDKFLHCFLGLGLISIRLESRNNKYNSNEIMYCFPKAEIAFTIEDVDDNPIEYYLNYYGGEQFFCKTCGKMTTKKSNRQILCPSCWEERQKELWKNNSKNYRRKKTVIVSDA